jgi:Pyruvate/2-oxoacid:ferredoxin oxidoreductase delta subunit
MNDQEKEKLNVERIEIGEKLTLTRRGLLRGGMVGAMSLVASSNIWLPATAEAKWKPADPEHLRRWNGVSPAHIKVAENYSSPLIIGPRMSDELVELIQHLYSEEEAEVVQYLTPWSSKTAEKIARQAGRPVSEVQTILDRIIDFQNSILALKSDTGPSRYNIFWFLPGTFDAVLVKPDESCYTDWHREFCRRWEKLYNTGDLFEPYLDKPVDLIRFIPTYPAIKNNPCALPSDKLPMVLERYDMFAMTLCQCTTVAKFEGFYCGRPHFTCLAMGNSAKAAIEKGTHKRVELQEALDIKMQAEEAGLSTWVFNWENEGMESNISCSCCGCCCVALRSLTQFDKPGLVARPHFMPTIDQEKCLHCKKCVDRCNMGAHKVTETSHTHDPLRCVGCGLCAIACPAGAITMEEVPDYKTPPKSAAEYVLRKAPNILSNIMAERKKRKSLG